MMPYLNYNTGAFLICSVSRAVSSLRIFYDTVRIDSRLARTVLTLDLTY